MTQPTTTTVMPHRDFSEIAQMTASGRISSIRDQVAEERDGLHRSLRGGEGDRSPDQLQQGGDLEGGQSVEEGVVEWPVQDDVHDRPGG